MGKPMIALVTGGLSGEAEISYKSAVTIQNNIDLSKFDYHTIDIRKDGWWCLVPGESLPVDKNDFSVTIGDKVIHFDAVLMGIHGTPGEDGKLPGYFDMLNIPYTNCNAATSAITFNKRYTVAVAALAGISVARSMHFFKNDIIDYDAVSASLQYPLFIKPANGGSSIGMSKIAEHSQLEAAIAKAFVEDDQVLVEEFIAGREFTIGVARLNGHVTPLPMTEVISQNYFFDFEAKYQGKSQEITPAIVDETIAEQVRLAARRLYEIFNCNGVIRIDFIYNEEMKTPYMLEINTVPGQSAASIVPQQVKAMGMELKDFYSGLIEDCLQRHHEKLMPAAG